MHEDQDGLDMSGQSSKDNLISTFNRFNRTLQLRIHTLPEWATCQKLSPEKWYTTSLVWIPLHECY